MRKFDYNTRVLFKVNGDFHRGRVTGLEHSTRRVVTDSGRRLLVSVRSLRPARDRSLILETRLDRNLRSNRTYGPMMQQLLYAFDVEALYERIHTVDSMRRFLRQEGKDPATRFIHVMSHGTVGPKPGSATLHLTFDDLDLVKQADVFKGLRDKILLFSCCQIGQDRDVLELIKEVSQAAAVISYRVDVDDWYTNIAEALLYERLIKTTMSPKRAVSMVGEVLHTLGVKVDGIVTRKPVLVCV